MFIIAFASFPLIQQVKVFDEFVQQRAWEPPLYMHCAYTAITSKSNDYTQPCRCLAKFALG